MVNILKRRAQLAAARRAYLEDVEINGQAAADAHVAQRLMAATDAMLAAARVEVSSLERPARDWGTAR